MRTIAIINQKGGCGKTTVALNLAAELARQHQRALLVDMDPQGHCALGLSVPEAQIASSMAELLIAGLDGSTSVVETAWQVSRRLDLLPATMSLAGVEQRLAGASDKDRRLSQVLATVQGRYDVCVIDCPPAIGLLTFNALRAADEVIVPVETGYFALQGAVKQQQTIEMLARRVAHRLKLHVLATMYDPAASHARPLFSELQRQFGDYLIPATIHDASQLQEAASFGQAVTEYAPHSAPARDFNRLARWLIEHPPAEPAIGEPSPAIASPEPPRPPRSRTRQPEATPAAGSTGTTSRAAELVERARELSARTAAISRQLSRDEATPVTDTPERSTEPGQHASQPLVASPETEPASPVRDGSGEREAAPASTLRRTLGVRTTRSGLLFVQPTGQAQQVAVVGDFNGWDTAASPLIKDERLGVHQRCVPVPAGRYRYRLLIDGQPQVDPYNDETDRDAAGCMCSVVTMPSG